MTEAEILQFASAYDSQWFHTDPDRTSKGRFGGVIASGWHTCGIAMRLVAQSASSRLRYGRRWHVTITCLHTFASRNRVSNSAAEIGRPTK